jgi:hypothetical protein
MSDPLKTMRQLVTALNVWSTQNYEPWQLDTALNVSTDPLKTMSHGSWLQPWMSDPLKTRYDYNLMIMESPKPATDNRFKKINQKLPLKSNNVEFLQYCGDHFENGDR